MFSGVVGTCCASLSSSEVVGEVSSYVVVPHRKVVEEGFSSAVGELGIFESFDIINLPIYFS